jgi:phosphoserine phosphatase
VEDPIIDARAKLEALIETRGELGLNPEQVLAIGDGANDRLMIEEAGLGVAYRGKPALDDVADARIEHHGLDALLWAQGIRKKEWLRG